MDIFFNADISHACLTLSTDNWQTYTNEHLSTMTTIFCLKRGYCAEVQLLFRSCHVAASPVYNQLCWSKICNFHLLLSSHPARCPLMYLAKSIVVLCCSSGIQKLRINLGFSETDHPPTHPVSQHWET